MNGDKRRFVSHDELMGRLNDQVGRLEETFPPEPSYEAKMYYRLDDLVDAFENMDAAELYTLLMIVRERTDPDTKKGAAMRAMAQCYADARRGK
jgi:hypothetical protein